MINTVLEKLYLEDKKERDGELTQSQVGILEKNTSKRLKQVYSLLPNIDESEIWNCHYVAYLLQHGSSSEDLKLAHKYARKAVKMGSRVTKWLYAATKDRYLISTGRSQKYGTQYQIINGKKVYYPSDGTISKSEKLEHGVVSDS